MTPRPASSATSTPAQTGSSSCRLSPRTPTSPSPPPANCCPPPERGTVMANDVDAIRAVHDAWFAANVNLDGEAMLPTLSTSDQFLQFNLNGLVYNGAQEKYKLWKHLN